MKRTFEIQTTKSRIEKVNGRRTVKTEPMTLMVDVRIEGKVILLGYGYKEWWTEGREDAFSALPGQKYKLHHSIHPKEGDVWKFGQRTFTVGQREGFVCYTAPLLENGKQVATIKFEDYYKD